MFAVYMKDDFYVQDVHKLELKLLLPLLSL